MNDASATSRDRFDGLDFDGLADDAAVRGQHESLSFGAGPQTPASVVCGVQLTVGHVVGETNGISLQFVNGGIYWSLVTERDVNHVASVVDNRYVRQITLS